MNRNKSVIVFVQTCSREKRNSQARLANIGPSLTKTDPSRSSGSQAEVKYPKSGMFSVRSSFILSRQVSCRLLKKA
jgi:hypothetical protein